MSCRWTQEERRKHSNCINDMKYKKIGGDARTYCMTAGNQGVQVQCLRDATNTSPLGPGPLTPSIAISKSLFFKSLAFLIPLFSPRVSQYMSKIIFMSSSCHLQMTSSVFLMYPLNCCRNFNELIQICL